MTSKFCSTDVCTIAASGNAGVRASSAQLFPDSSCKYFNASERIAGCARIAKGDSAILAGPDDRLLELRPALERSPPFVEHFTSISDDAKEKEAKLRDAASKRRPRTCRPASLEAGPQRQHRPADRSHAPILE